MSRRQEIKRGVVIQNPLTFTRSTFDPESIGHLAPFAPLTDKTRPAAYFDQPLDNAVFYYQSGQNPRPIVDGMDFHHPALAHIGTLGQVVRHRYFSPLPDEYSAILINSGRRIMAALDIGPAGSFVNYMAGGYASTAYPISAAAETALNTRVSEFVGSLPAGHRQVLGVAFGLETGQAHSIVETAQITNNRPEAVMAFFDNLSWRRKTRNKLAEFVGLPPDTYARKKLKITCRHEWTELLVNTLGALPRGKSDLTLAEIGLTPQVISRIPPVSLLKSAYPFRPESPLLSLLLQPVSQLAPVSPELEAALVESRLIDPPRSRT